MKTLKTFGILLILTFVLSLSVHSMEVKKMTKETLKPILDKKSTTILDVRTGRDWSSSEFKIKNAKRVTGKDLISSTQSLPKNQTLVLYCA